MGIASILEKTGIAKPDPGYLDPINHKLEEIKTDLNAVADTADYCSSIVDALKNDDKSRAVDATLKFCKIDDDVKELLEIQKKIEAGEHIDAAVAAANGPVVITEIVTSTRKEIGDRYSKVTELVSDVRDLIQLINDKIQNIRVEAAGLSWAQKILTADALRKTLIQVKQIQDGASDSMKKLEALPKSLEGITA